MNFKSEIYNVYLLNINMNFHLKILNLVNNTILLFSLNNVSENKL